MSLFKRFISKSEDADTAVQTDETDADAIARAIRAELAAPVSSGLEDEFATFSEDETFESAFDHRDMSDEAHTWLNDPIGDTNIQDSITDSFASNLLEGDISAPDSVIETIEVTAALPSYDFDDITDTYDDDVEEAEEEEEEDAEDDDIEEDMSADSEEEEFDETDFDEEEDFFEEDELYEETEAASETDNRPPLSTVESDLDRILSNMAPNPQTSMFTDHDQVEDIEALTAEAATPAQDSDDMNDYSDLDALAAPSERLNLSELRLDIVRITSDIDSGEALFRRAQQRVDSLIGFIEQAEVSVSALHRMEPENRRLKSRNRALETEAKTAESRLVRLETELKTAREDGSAARKKLDAAKVKLSQTLDALKDRNTALEAARRKAEDNKMAAERIRTNLDIETQENITLREKMTELSDRVERLSKERLELSKSHENLTTENRDLTDANNALELTLTDMRFKLGETEHANRKMKTDFSEIQESLVTFKAAHESNVSQRDDRIRELEQTVEILQKKLKVKEDIVESAVLDVNALRKAKTAQDIEREKLEKIIERQNYQLNKAQDDLLQSKQDMDTLDRRYRDVASSLAAHNTFRAQVRSEQPDIHPRMEEPTVETPAVSPASEPSLADILSTYTMPDNPYAKQG